jgi:hypothetical protein
MLTTVWSLENGVGLLPPLGWSTWNRFGFAINETLIHEVADALLATGLARAGFVHVNVDAGMWAPNRDAAGNLQTNAAFPSGARALAEYVHARGLKLGLYSDLGVGSCDPHGPGSGGHWPQDAAFMAAAGMDYLYVYAKNARHAKPPNPPPPPPHTHTVRWTTAAIRKSTTPPKSSQTGAAWRPR